MHQEKSGNPDENSILLNAVASWGRFIEHVQGFFLMKRLSQDFVVSAKVSDLGKFGDNIQLVSIWPKS
jgi:hypothetical protein